MILKRTPLFEAHQRAGARLVDFGGWEMPVQYSGIVDEHLRVRRAAGIFDISHMGEVAVSGPGALEFLNRLLTNDAARLAPGEGQYTLMCNPAGGAIDDLYLYRLAESEFLMVINASRITDDVRWIEARRQELNGQDVVIADRSAELAAVAVQGPRCVECLELLLPGIAGGGTAGVKVSALKKNQIGRFPFAGTEVWAARTGYTGEDGFEVIAPALQIEPIWNRLLESGRAAGLQPCGLGARDTLRTEMGYPLYGHELSETITPIEAGLGFFCALDKRDFCGKAALLEQKSHGPARKGIAFVMAGKSAPPRAGYPILLPHTSGVIGEVTSGTQSPSLNCGIGLALVAAEHAGPDRPLEIEIRGRRFEARVVKKPIYRKPAS